MADDFLMSRLVGIDPKIFTSTISGAIRNNKNNSNNTTQI